MKNRLLALFEILGILAVGWTLTRIFIEVSGVPPLQDYLNQALVNERPDFYYLAELGFLTLLIQFLCLMTPAILLTTFLRRDRAIVEFGISGSTTSFKDNVILGIALFVVLGIPMKVLLLVNQLIPLGTQPEYWELFNKEWDIGFWVFMAVGSFVVIPIFEEVFYRGYAQYRLQRESGFAAVITIPVVFVVAHFQYYVPDILNIGMLVSLLFLSFGMAFSRFRSKSIIAAVGIHALMNIPTKYPYDLLVLLFMTVVAVVLRREIGSLKDELVSHVKGILPNSVFIELTIALLFGLGMNFMPEVTLVGFFLLFIVSIVIQTFDRRKLNKHSI